MPGYVHKELHALQHKKPKQPQDPPYTWTQLIYGKNNHMLSDRAPSEELDGNNQKRLQKIVEFFYIMLDP